MDSKEPERGVVRRHERGESPRGAGEHGHSVGRRGRYPRPGSAAGVQRRRRRQRHDAGIATVWNDGRRRVRREPVLAEVHGLGSTTRETREERRHRGPEHHASPVAAHCLRPVIYASEHRVTHRHGLITVVIEINYNSSK